MMMINVKMMMTMMMMLLLFKVIGDKYAMMITIT